MEKATQLQKIKQELKQLAVEIKTHRAGRKESSPTHGQYDQSHDLRLSRKFRHMHIAYCLARGTAYELIESPRPDNAPCRDTVEGYLKAWEVADEAVCCHS